MALNDWLPFLEDNPEMLYNAMIPSSPSKTFRDYYLARFNKIYNEYLGGLGQTMLGGGEPKQNFSDYLKGFDFLKNWSSLSPLSRGQRSSSRVYWNV